MTEPLFERFMDPATMIDAERELLVLGEAAVPILASLLNGEAKTSTDVPYRDFGLPRRCALEVARRLGRLAKPLEPYLLNELEAGDWVAAMTLGSLESLAESSIQELANQLDANEGDLAFESAIALLKCDCARHAFVRHAVEKSARGAWVLAGADKYLSTRVIE